MSADASVQRAVRTVIQIHRDRQEQLRRALESGDEKEVVKCLRHQLGIENVDEGNRPTSGKQRGPGRA